MNCEKTTTREINAKAYRGQYLVYCRKSTDDAENQKNSLEHQRQEISAFAERTNLQVAPVDLAGFCANGVISESHSGFCENDDLRFSRTGEIRYRIRRPKFNQMVRFLNDGCFAGVICMSWDRLSRNKTDNAIITKLMRKGVDVQFVGASYDDSSAGALHMDIDGMFAQHHSRVTKEKVTNAMRRMRDEGIVVYKAPLGYENTGKKYQDVRSKKHKPFDPVRAPIVKEIFEKYATGDWSISDLAQWANDQGLRNFAKRRPRTKAEMLSEEAADVEAVETPINRNNIFYILRNRFYIGLSQDSHGQWIPSLSHEPLIDQELFDEVQRRRGEKQRSIRYKQPVCYPFRGFIRCSKCRRLYTPYVKKGIQYFGTRCAPGCTNSKKNCNLRYIETEVTQVLEELFLKPHELSQLDENTDIGLAKVEARVTREQAEVERNRRKLNEDLAYLRKYRLELLRSGVYSPESYIEEEERLLRELNDTNQREMISQEALHETVKDAIKLSELLNDLVVNYVCANSTEKAEIVRFLFSELTMSEDTFGCRLKNEYRALKRHGVLSSAPDTWLSELVANRGMIANGIAKLEGRVPGRAGS